MSDYARHLADEHRAAALELRGDFAKLHSKVSSFLALAAELDIDPAVVITAGLLFHDPASNTPGDRRD